MVNSFSRIFNNSIEWELLNLIWYSYDKQGSCEALHRSCGCCGSFLEDEAQREQCETACDFATHFCCHSCALCQEGREVRRRLPHPGFNAQPILVMIPPVEQSMGRGAWELPPLAWKLVLSIYGTSAIWYCINMYSEYLILLRLGKHI